MKHPPPASEEELQARAETLSGRTLQQIATLLDEPVPPDQSRHKGWTGELLERYLGASASSLPEPDFQAIGVELKSLPVNRHGRPNESTYVCTVPLTPRELGNWQASAVRRKLARVLWVPVEAGPGLPLPERRIGTPLLWSPDREQERQLREDWEELTGMIAVGELEQITAGHGRILQVRPKAADGKVLRRGPATDGGMNLTLPRGFYLRASFTASILERIPGATNHSS